MFELPGSEFSDLVIRKSNLGLELLMVSWLLIVWCVEWSIHVHRYLVVLLLLEIAIKYTRILLIVQDILINTICHGSHLLSDLITPCSVIVHHHVVASVRLVWSSLVKSFELILSFFASPVCKLVWWSCPDIFHVIFPFLLFLLALLLNFA